MIVDLIRNTKTIEVRVGPRGPRGESGASTWASITDKPATFPPSAHTHAQSEITGLVAALAGKAPTSHTHTQSDVTGLSAALAAKADLVDGMVPTAQIPAIAITEFLGSVASQSAMLALNGQRGDWCNRSDVSKAFVLVAEPASTLSNWAAIDYPAGPVLSVNGQTGTIVLGKADIGLGNVSNALQLVASNNLSDLPNADTARTNLGLGTLATQNANDVTISGGTITGINLDGSSFQSGQFTLGDATTQAFISLFDDSGHQMDVHVETLTNNRAVSFGDASGTILTTGSTGAITSSLIADGTITNAKIADGTIQNGKLAITPLAITGGSMTGLLQFSGTTHAGVRLNNLTTTQINSLATTAAGMLAWNTTTSRMNVYDGTAWTSGFVRLAGDAMTGNLTFSGSAGLVSANPLFPTRTLSIAASVLNWANVNGSGFGVSLSPTTPSADRTVQFNPNGAIVSTADTGSVATAMLADGAVTAAKLSTSYLPLSGGTLTGAFTANVGTLSTAGLTLNQTWNAGAGTTHRGLDLATTVTSAGASSTHLRIRGGASGTTDRFTVTEEKVTITGTESTGRVLDLISSYGTTPFNVSGGGTLTINNSLMSVGSTGEVRSTVVNNGNFFCGIGFEQTTNVAFIRPFGTGATTLQVGVSAASPVAHILRGASSRAGTDSNTAGASLTIAGGNGTGTGGGGALIFQTAPTGSSGSTANTLTTRMTIKASGVINMSGTPTSATGLSSGDIWRDDAAGGVLKQVP